MDHFVTSDVEKARGDRGESPLALEIGGRRARAGRRVEGSNRRSTSAHGRVEGAQAREEVVTAVQQKVEACIEHGPSGFPIGIIGVDGAGGRGQGHDGAGEDVGRGGEG
ncbi:unnamed protein product [Adineta steineri]|uniref:Uncharacterized protein n=1 Tax=Adineta steineri TaxID=433720 RepID=A0A814ZL49_9BILA|nr:unnamed protein product [Adineta steineri]CAF3643738.1 unnamed protein product [Adineta steineri]